MEIEELENYTLEQLEERILKRCAVSETVDDELETYLRARQWKINDTFEWTPENIEKLLRLDRKLLNCFEKIKAEAGQIIKTLQKRIDEKDTFLHDFGIEAHIYPSILVPNKDGELCEPEDGMDRILMDCLEKYRYVTLDIGGIYRMEDFNRILYLDKKQNWNDDYPFKGNFSEHFISQGIHDLYDHTCWSFKDILKINHLCTELRIIQDNYEEV